MSAVQPEGFQGRKIAHLPAVAAIFKDCSDGQDAVEDLGKTVKLLQGDAARSVSFYNRSRKSQFWRRNVIKNSFAWFEGQIFLMKRQALIMHRHYQIGFDLGELALLGEYKYSLDENGQTTSANTNFQQLVLNIQFAFRCFLRAHGVGEQFDLSRIPDLKKLTKVRNRLTHPKSAADLFVSDDEMEVASKVLSWHMKESADIFKRCSPKGTVPIRMPALDSRTSLSLTLPVLLYLRDGSAYEFPTKAEARAFAKAVGAGRLQKDFLLYHCDEFDRKSLP